MVSRSITEIDHRDADIAKLIHQVFQCAYAVEAQLIGFSDFPPMQIQAQDIQQADTRFFGCWEANKLAAVAEITHHKNQLDIDTLVVEPEFFRQGLASKLLNYVLTELKWKTASVETALANLPAIALYQKLGFSIQQEWDTPEAIRKVLLTK